MGRSRSWFHPVSYTHLMLIVISQLAVAYVIELAGLFGVDKEPFEWRKILGLLIAIFGIIIFKWQK